MITEMKDNLIQIIIFLSFLLNFDPKFSLKDS